jgi:hypothetical protein
MASFRRGIQCFLCLSLALLFTVYLPLDGSVMELHLFHFQDGAAEGRDLPKDMQPVCEGKLV